MTRTQIPGPGDGSSAAQNAARGGTTTGGAARGGATTGGAAGDAAAGSPPGGVGAGGGSAPGGGAHAPGAGGGAHAALLAAQVFFSTLPIATKIVFRLLPSMPPAGLVLFRVTGAAAILLLAAHLGGRRPVADRRDNARLALYALLGVAINQLLFIGGLKYTTAINSQVIGTTIPVFAIAFGAALGRERLTRARAIGVALAVAGTLYLVGLDRVRMSPDTTLGNAMIAANACSYALYLVLSKSILARYDPIVAVSRVFLFGALFVAPFGAYALAGSGAIGAATAPVWAGILFIVLVPTVGSYWLNTWALKRARPSVVAAYVYLQPILTALLAVWLLGEGISPRLPASAALIFLGVALVSRPAGRTGANGGDGSPAAA